MTDSNAKNDTFDARSEQSEDARFIVRNAMNHLDQELDALSIWELTRFAWKCWWAILLASIPLAIGALILTVIVARFGR